MVFITMKHVIKNHEWKIQQTNTKGEKHLGNRR